LFVFSLFHIHTLTHSHKPHTITQEYIHTLTRTISLTHVLTLTSTVSLLHTHTNTHTRTSHTNTHTHSLTHALKLISTLSLLHTYSHSQALSLSYTLTLTHTHTHKPHEHTLSLTHALKLTSTLSLSYTRTLTHTHTHAFLSFVGLCALTSGHQVEKRFETEAFFWHRQPTIEIKTKSRSFSMIFYSILLTDIRLCIVFNFGLSCSTRSCSCRGGSDVTKFRHLIFRNPGVNFINILLTAFTHADSKSAKR